MECSIQPRNRRGGADVHVKETRYRVPTSPTSLHENLHVALEAPYLTVVDSVLPCQHDLRCIRHYVNLNLVFVPGLCV